MLMQVHWGTLALRELHDSCIAIRTAIIQDGNINLQAGAGIVADSVPEMEFQETINKAKGMFYASLIAEKLDQS